MENMPLDAIFCLATIANTSVSAEAKTRYDKLKRLVDQALGRDVYPELRKMAGASGTDYRHHTLADVLAKALSSNPSLAISVGAAVHELKQVPWN